MKKRGEHFSKKQKIKMKGDFVVALKKTLGVYSAAAEQVGVDRKTIWLWRKEDPLFAELCDQVNELALDFVESALFKRIAGGDTRAIIYYLENKGAQRGYAKEHVVSVNADVNVTGRPAVRLEPMQEIDEQ